MTARERLAIGAASAAFLAASWALAVFLSGGIRLRLGPVLVSSRSALRPALIAAVASALAVMLAPRGRRLVVYERLRQLIERASPAAALLAAFAVLWVTLVFGARAAGGADTFGYVSYAYLWVNRSLEIAQPLASQVPWPHADESLTPLGYRSGVTAHTIVPTYSPGLPLIMAVLHLTLGRCGPYLVQPLFGTLLVAITYGLGFRLTRDRLTSSLAAVFMAASPTLLFNLMTPMSDTATAALWIGSLWLLTWPGVAPAAVAGLVASLATLVRPNLVPLVVPAAVAAAMWPHAHHVDGLAARPRLARVGAFLTAAVPGALTVAYLNNVLYGSALLSGYGRAGNLYSVGWLGGNAGRYASWFVESQSLFALLAAVPLLLRRTRPAWLTRATVIPPALLVAIVCLSYLFYQQFPEWWFLRFLLTAFPFVFLLVAAALAWFFRAAPALVALPALMIAVSLALQYSIGFTVGLGTLDIGRGEERYAAVGRYIDRELPADAIVLSMQHSGTIRMYGGRTTLRYEYVLPERFQSTLDWLTANGHRPYVLLENWELTRWRQHFSSDPRVARLDFRLLAELDWPAGIRLYDPLSPPGPPELVRQIPVDEERNCLMPRGAWRVRPE